MKKKSRSRIERIKDLADHCVFNKPFNDTAPSYEDYEDLKEEFKGRIFPDEYCIFDLEFIKLAYGKMEPWAKRRPWQQK